MDANGDAGIFPLEAAENAILHHQAVFKGEGGKHNHKLGGAKAGHDIVSAQAVQQTVLQAIHAVI